MMKIFASSFIHNGVIGGRKWPEVLRPYRFFDWLGVGNAMLPEQWLNFFLFVSNLVEKHVTKII